MAAREPYEPPPERTDYTVVEHRSSGALWAVLIVLVLLVIAAAALWYTGAFNGRPLSSETSKTNIKVTVPAPGSGNTGSGSTGGGRSGGGGPGGAQ